MVKSFKAESETIYLSYKDITNIIRRELLVKLIPSINVDSLPSTEKKITALKFK